MYPSRPANESDLMAWRKARYAVPDEPDEVDYDERAEHRAIGRAMVREAQADRAREAREDR